MKSGPGTHVYATKPARFRPNHPGHGFSCTTPRGLPRPYIRRTRKGSWFWRLKGHRRVITGRGPPKDISSRAAPLVFWRCWTAQRGGLLPPPRNRRGGGRVYPVGTAGQTDAEVGVVQERHEQLAERLRTAEQARDLLKELERRLKDEDSPELEDHLTRLDRLAQPLPEADRIRWFIESAAGSVRAGRAGKAGTDVSRSRSAIEGEISTLQGTIDHGVT